MKRTAMLNRSGFKRPELVERPRPVLAPIRQVAEFRLQQIVAQPKEQVIQHSGYMDAVRDLPCAHCGKAPIPVRSQFCHSDAGKGMGIKTDCRRGWPGCADCHRLIGSTGLFKQWQRRILEERYSTATRAAVIAAGLWPARLPRWIEP